MSCPDSEVSSVPTCSLLSNLLSLVLQSKGNKFLRVCVRNSVMYEEIKYDSTVMKMEKSKEGMIE